MRLEVEVLEGSEVGSGDEVGIRSGIECEVGIGGKVEIGSGGKVGVESGSGGGLHWMEYSWCKIECSPEGEKTLWSGRSIREVEDLLEGGRSDCSSEFVRSSASG